MHGAVGLDGENAGVLRMFLEDVGQKGGTSRLVLTVDQWNPPQAEQQLSRAGDAVVQLGRDRLQALDELFARLRAVRRAYLQQQPEHHQQRQQRCCQRQQQNTRA